MSAGRHPDDNEPGVHFRAEYEQPLALKKIARLDHA
jgi:hypothetical protein